MLTELIMGCFGWESAWCVDAVDPADPPPGSCRVLPWRVFRRGPAHPLEGGFLLGTWTGPEQDLLCVRRCETAAEAERALSPSGRTLLLAASAGALKRALIATQDRIGRWR